MAQKDEPKLYGKIPLFLFATVLLSAPVKLSSILRAASLSGAQRFRSYSQINVSFLMSGIHMSQFKMNRVAVIEW